MSDAPGRLRKGRLGFVLFLGLSLVACLVHFFGGYSFVASACFVLLGLLVNGIMLLVGDLRGGRKTRDGSKD